MIQITQKQFKEFRLKKGYTIRAIASLTGMSTKTIQNIEACHMVNMSKIDAYLRGLSLINHELYMFIYIPKDVELELKANFK